MKSRIRCNLLKPCKKILKFFKFKLRKPLFIRSIHCRRDHKGGNDQVTELTSFSDALNHQKAPQSSPLTPAYITRRGGDDVEDACRSFEKYLINMVVDEGKMRDLVDVEELLYCWKNLRSPVFIDLVCRFYGELCKDLFSNSLVMTTKLEL